MFKITARVSLIVLLISILSSSFCLGEMPVVESEKLPLWEYGVVGLAARLPHYRGSDEYQNYAFPLPYFVYRGDVVKANRDGVRGIFLRSKRFESDISFSGNPPVSDDNEAREGMPDLDGLIEIGPALRYYFYEFGERNAIYLQANLRAAFSVGFDEGLNMAHQGNVADVSLVYKDSKLLESQKMRFDLSAGVQFGDAKLHSYFYEVLPNFVTPAREQYEAEGGYGGLQLSGSILKELTANFWLSLYGRWMNSSGTVFEDSPLVRTSNNYVVGILLTWKIGESAQLER